jgi:hypothetical protein
MQLLISVSLMLLSFNVAGTQGTKPATKSLFSVTSPPMQSHSPIENVVASSSDVLKGLKGLYVHAEEITNATKAVGLDRDAITQRVELTMRRNGIRVLNREEVLQEAGDPYVHVYVRVSGTESRIELRCNQNVRSEINPSVKIIGATIWSTVGHGAAEYTKDGIDQVVERFCNEYLKANPK